MNHKALFSLALVAFVTACFTLSATAKRPVTKRKNADVTKVEMFSAMKAGQIEVKIIPRDSKQATVLITNKTKKPLGIQLPETFAGVPVLAQFDAGRGGGRDRGGNQNNSANQSFGGGMMGGGMGGMGGMMGGGMMGGMFNVAPARIGKFKVATVCLEHGKKDPAPRIPYKVVPLKEFTKNPAVAELCKILGSGQIDQSSAQAAAWNLANNMSWNQLAHKNIKRLNGARYPYFTRQQIATGMRAAYIATQRSQAAKEEKSRSESETFVSPGEQAALGKS